MDCHQSLIVEDQTSYLKLKEGVLDSVEMRVWTGDKGMDGERESPRMCRLIFLLGQNVTSHMKLNVGVIPKVFLTRSVWQGYPLSPLLFAIVTHPLLAMLSNVAASGDIVVCIFLLVDNCWRKHWLMILYVFTSLKRKS